jgi:hypothetical protein
MRRDPLHALYVEGTPARLVADAARCARDGIDFL